MDRNGSYQTASPPRQRAIADSVVAQQLDRARQGNKPNRLVKMNFIFFIFACL
jgi:hypothetical protein